MRSAFKKPLQCLINERVNAVTDYVTVHPQSNCVQQWLKGKRSKLGPGISLFESRRPTA